jgi:hypothetical protein
LNPIESPSIDFVMSFLNLDRSNGFAIYFPYLFILYTLNGCLSRYSGQVSAM